MNRGFTLMELLVAAAIIGIHSSVATAMISSSQLKARDSERITQVRQLQKALSLYQIETNLFPIHTTAITITGSDAFSLALEERDVMPEVPADPNHPNTVYTYQSNAAGNDYTITFCLDTSTISGYSQGCGNTITP